MNRLSHFVSLHPYFRVHPGKLEMFKAALPEFAVKTRGESQNLFDEFTINGDEVFCREGYVNARRGSRMWRMRVSCSLRRSRLPI